MVGTDIAQRSDMSSGGRSAVITSCICCIMAVLCEQPFFGRGRGLKQPVWLRAAPAGSYASTI